MARDPRYTTLAASSMWGPRTSGPKYSWELKNVDYSPPKRAEMREITSFDDAARVVYWGSRGIEILPGPEKRGLQPTKRPEKLEITSFDNAARVMYRGSRGIEILTGPEKRGL